MKLFLFSYWQGFFFVELAVFLMILLTSMLQCKEINIGFSAILRLALCKHKEENNFSPKYSHKIVEIFNS